MHFIGDIHGQFYWYLLKIQTLGASPSIQIGDFGLGFGDKEPEEFPQQHKFIRGNHDDPNVCRKHPNYLGDYGVTEDGIFFVGGAYSIDYLWRQQHNLVNPNKPVWWADEEIGQEEWEKIFELYEKTHPSIVVSHDCPRKVSERLLGGHARSKQKFINDTCDGLLTELEKMWRPDYWVFGHYHQREELNIEGTKYICLEEFGTIEIGESNIF